MADWIESKWLESGLEEVTRSTYDFLLSYPDPDKPNRIHLFDANNTMVSFFRKGVKKTSTF